MGTAKATTAAEWGKGRGDYRGVGMGLAIFSLLSACSLVESLKGEEEATPPSVWVSPIGTVLEAQPLPPSQAECLVYTDMPWWEAKNAPKENEFLGAPVVCTQDDLARSFCVVPLPSTCWVEVCPLLGGLASEPLLWRAHSSHCVEP